MGLQTIGFSGVCVYSLVVVCILLYLTVFVQSCLYGSVHAILYFGVPSSCATYAPALGSPSDAAGLYRI